MDRSARSLVALVVVCLAGAPVAAGALEAEIESRWLGAWVLTRTESYSSCSGLYTNNRVNGTFIRSSGAVAFEPGELAKIDKIDVNRSRVDVLVAVAEPVLLDEAEGPFTLYHEATCRVEFEIEVPRAVVKSHDADAMDRAIAAVLARFATPEEATAAAAYNARVRREYPDDYDLTLAALDVWRAERTNDAVRSGLDAATETAARLADRIDGDPVYLAGFSTGVERARSTVRDECATLVTVDLDALEPRFRHDMTPEERRRLRGEADGASLVTALAMLRRLPACFVPVPADPDAMALATTD